MANFDITIEFDFIKYLQNLKFIERANKTLINRNENVAEHSWSIALMSWILLEEFQKEFSQILNIERMIKIALIHDVVEIISGDTKAWDKNKISSEKQSQNEHEAAIKIFSNLQTQAGREMLALWEEYEFKDSLEKKIIKGLDRISAAIHRLDTNQGWLDVHGTTRELDKIQLPRISFSNTLLYFYKLLIEEAISRGLIENNGTVAQLDMNNIDTVNIEKKYKFIRKSRELKGVLRHVYSSKNRKENCAEHSWSIAMMVWVLHDSLTAEFNKSTDLLKMIKMCLLHDIPKIYTGDVSVWDNYTLSIGEQYQNEKTVLVNILFRMLSKSLSTEMKNIWEEYNEIKTLEAKIVKAIEREAAALQRLISGQGWDDVKATVKELDIIQLERVGFSKTLTEFYEKIKLEAIKEKLLKF